MSEAVLCHHSLGPQTSSAGLAMLFLCVSAVSILTLHLLYDFCKTLHVRTRAFCLFVLFRGESDNILCLEIGNCERAGSSDTYVAFVLIA